DSTARLIRVEDGATIATLRHPGMVWSVGFHPDGRTMLTAAADRVRFWDGATGAAVGPEVPSQGKHRIAAFSPDGRAVVITSFEKFAQLHDVATGRPIGRRMHHGDIRVATFSPDGRRLLTATYDGTARLWDAHNGEPASPLLVHRHWVQAAAFSLDGR